MTKAFERFCLSWEDYPLEEEKVGRGRFPEVASYRRILGVFPGIVLLERRRRPSPSNIRVCVHVWVCICVRARISLFLSSLFLVSLPSQPSTSPRLVSNDFPPSYPDSGTHPWGNPSNTVTLSYYSRHPWFLSKPSLPC